MGAENPCGRAAEALTEQKRIRAAGAKEVGVGETPWKSCLPPESHPINSSQELRG